MRYSVSERAAHVRRRLGLGGFAADDGDIDTALAAALDLSTPASEPSAIEPPADHEAARDGELVREGVAWWLEQMIDSPRPLEERR